MMRAKIIAVTWMMTVVRYSPAAAVSVPLSRAISDIRIPAVRVKKDT